MTVAELITALQGMPGDAPAVIFVNGRATSELEVTRNTAYRGEDGEIYVVFGRNPYSAFDVVTIS